MVLHVAIVLSRSLGFKTGVMSDVGWTQSVQLVQNQGTTGKGVRKVNFYGDISPP